MPLHLLLALFLQLVIAFLCLQKSDGAYCKRPVDIAFAIDASGSVGRYGYYQEKNFVRNTMAKFGISRSGTHAAVIVYSTKAEVAISFPQYTSYSSFYYAVGRIPYKRGVTRIDLALKLAAEQVFVGDGGSRSNVPKILVVMTDGYQTRTADSVSLDRAVLPLRAKGVQVYALAIGQYVKEYELRLIVENSAHIFKSRKFRDLRTVMGKLARTTCTNGE
ncbi:hypothetical protein OS493_017761 [Desmophyllum pertusum]|uniref:VWFA domain-containing protein n=1 Tax=Desmophyllum pertusum TaxID=174260 RepID=A0A9W9ZCW8_9CNID|nr:hypothetical protein OS493_017761 [Desmophyllum pertusum]